MFRPQLDETPPIDDVVRPFRLGAAGARGRHVRLGPSVDTALTQHAYPRPVSSLLGELMALTATLASTIKYEGVFSAQIKGDGPVGQMVADVTSEGVLRGYAGFDQEALTPENDATSESFSDGPVQRLLGAGYLAFTVDQGPDTERYQGMVALEGATLSECAHHYFRKSEQIETGIALAAGEGEDGWRAGAMMLQRVPSEGGIADEEELPGARSTRPVPSPVEAEQTSEDWRRVVILMSSVRSEELLDPEIDSERLLLRLFSEEQVWVHRPRPIAFGCRCSRERAEVMLAAFPRSEIEAMKVDGRIVVTCQFCNRSHVFEGDQLDAVYQA